MSRVHKIMDTLHEKYGVDIDEFLELYKAKTSKNDLVEKLGLSYHTIRQIGDKLGLSWKKSERAKSYVALMIEISGETEAAQAAAEEPLRENDALSKKLAVAQRAVIRLRDEANQLRAEFRRRSREEVLEEKLQTIVEQALPIKDNRSFNIVAPLGSAHYKKHTSVLLLSDLHVEEAVTIQDVGLTNEYNWEIMERRLGALFATWLNTYRGESTAVLVCAGDFFTGFIHNALENTSKHPAEALQDLSDLLSRYVLSIAQVFDTVQIPVVNGNHSRFEDRIKSANKGFDLEFLFGQLLKAKVSSA